MRDKLHISFGRSSVSGACALVVGLMLQMTSPAAAGTQPFGDTRPAPTATYTPAETNYTYTFPRDHFAHDDYQTEWWYYTGHLHAKDGHSYGFELTFFRAAIARKAPGGSRWHGTQFYPAHFAITDETNHRFVFTERFERSALGLGSASSTELSVHTGTWSLTAGPHGAFRLHAAAPIGALNLLATSKKPPAIHGEGGISRKGVCHSCTSHYYSMTRLAVTGDLAIDGQTRPVTGIAWMDHEFGSGELTPDEVGWDWFALQLDDNRELMLYRIRRRDGGVSPYSSGSLIDPHGRVHYLDARDIELSTLSTWQSPHTHATYPATRRLRIAKIGLTCTLTPTVADQELVDPTGGFSYWEGAVRISGDHVSGAGYIELTGYTSPLKI